MPQKDTSEIKQKIISTIKNNGPSLPARIARETGMSMLFASAFLSELLSEKRLRITNMKVGSSPVYYLPGQEEQLESYSKYLKEKEKEAFLLLQEKKFIRDDKQEPAIRVALRSINDFAKYFQPEEGSPGYWRYFIVPEEDFYKNKENSSGQKNTEPPQKETNLHESKEKEASGPSKEKKEQSKQEHDASKDKKENEKPSNKHNIFESEKQKTPSNSSPKSQKKEKPVFVKEVLEYLNKKNIEVKQEISFKKKEYQAIIQINSDIGPVDFFLLAKGKKKISTDDVIDVINEAKKQKLYGLLLYSEEIQNKAEEFAEDNSQTLKVKKIE